MKKIMNLMLSLAVLFSFAACDNSSNTPDDEQTTTSTELNASQVQSAANAIYGILSDSTEGIAAAFTGAKTISGDYAAPSTTSYTYTWERKGTTALQGDTNLTITLNAQANAGATATDMDVVFENYSVEFSTSILDVYSGNYVTLAGTVGGPLVNTADVALSNGVVTSVTVGAWSETAGGEKVVILPTSASVTWNDESIDSEDLLACINKPTTGSNGAVATIAANYMTEKEYLDAKADKAEGQIKSFVTLLFNNSATTKLAGSLAAYVTNETGKTGFTVGGTNKATAYFEYAVPASETNAVVVANSNVTVTIAPGTTFRIDFESDDVEAATAASFTAAKYTLSGEFVITDANSTKTYSEFTKVKVDGLKGELTAGTVTGTNANGVSALAGVEFDDYTTIATTAPTAGTATATDVTTQAGPAIEKNGSNNWVRTQLGEASVKFPLD